MEVISSRSLWLTFASFPIKLPNLRAMGGGSARPGKDCREGGSSALLLVLQSGVWPLLLHSWPLGPGEGHCSGQPSQPCWMRAIFWDMEKAAWKREDRQNMQSTWGGGHLSAPRWASHRRTAMAHPTRGACCGCWRHAKERARHGRGGEGACDRWSASDWKHLTP